MQVFGGETIGKEHLEDPGVDGRIILTGILRKQAARIGNVSGWAHVQLQGICPQRSDILLFSLLNHQTHRQHTRAHS
jgi:hypothetical protein